MATDHRRMYRVDRLRRNRTNIRYVIRRNHPSKSINNTRIIFNTFFQVLVNDDKDYVQTETNKLSLYFFITGIVVFFAAVCEVMFPPTKL